MVGSRIICKLASVKSDRTTTYLPIKDWQEDDRPREKLIHKGAQALSNAELLAILIGSGSPSESAVSLTKRIIDEVDGSLRKLGRCDLESLMQFRGIGQAKAVTIMAACELSRRWCEETANPRPRLLSSADAYNLVRHHLGDLPHEEFHALLLNNGLYCLKDVTIGKGGLSATEVDVRLVVRSALLQNATALIVCHNHPGGTLTPSRADDQLTEKIVKAAQLMQIRIIDHLIIGENGYYSYAESGRL